MAECNRPERILQIGEGNFLRAFLEPLIQRANEQGYNGSVVIVPPRKWDNCARLMAQNGRYDVLVRGKQNGKVVDVRESIDCVSRCINPKTNSDALFALMQSPDLEMIVSNTTEAGIYYCKGVTLDTAMENSFAAMLTRLLWERYRAGEDGLWILPCELIEHNADALLQCVKSYAEDFNLPDKFFEWLNTCHFCNTLVDRIVTGHPADDTDPMSTACEPFFFWAIECEKTYISTFPIPATDLDVRVCENIEPYRMRKVRLLNGMHTAASAAALLSGISIVRDMVNDRIFRSFLQNYADAVIAVTPMDKDDLFSFRDAVFERFENPFIDHKLQGICMNSVSKFNSRCKAVMLYSHTTLVKMLSFTLAAILCYLTLDNAEIQDEEAVLCFARTPFETPEQRVERFLHLLPGTEPFASQVLQLWQSIQDNGVYNTLQTEAQTWRL